MKLYSIIVLSFISSIAFCQETDTIIVYKKRVLETTEVDFLASYYNQNGSQSAVSGGIGSEKLTDIVSNIVVAMPLNDDDVLTVDLGISAYTSASSSNINPFNSTGASGGGGGGDDDKYDDKYDDDTNNSTGPYGTPWLASSGASASDQLISLVANYSHSNDKRDFIWNGDVSFSNEYDYTSIGFGGGIAKLLNHKNTELNLKANVYLDQWRPIYPTELDQYATYGNNFLNQGYFNGVTVLDQQGQPSTAYAPTKFTEFTTTNRNSYALSFGLSQVVNTKLQFSIFFDLLQQQGLLSTPYQRIYFADNQHYYIGQPQYIQDYTSPNNIGVYELADDIERLPSSRFKLPIGARLNYYINELFILRTYYRYYSDNWGITSNTASIEIPIKISDRFTVYPMYRYYNQKEADYYSPYQTHLSTEEYYTSDPDLSTFYDNQYGFGVTYTDIFTGGKIWKFGIKNIDLRYNYYKRSNGLDANIASIAFKFIMQ